MANLPKFCYTLACDSADNKYATATYLSIAMLRRIYPDSTTALLLDSYSEMILRQAGSPLLDATDEVLVLDVEFESVVLRSRVLKVKLRQTVSGPYVFLDADALPIRPFDALFRHDRPAAAVVDRNGLFNDPQNLGGAPTFRQAMDFQDKCRLYYNSGVYYLADTAETRQFAERWEMYWRQAMDRNNVHYDQPAFNFALHHERLAVRRLPGSYNQNVASWPYMIPFARIFHFYMHREEVVDGSLLSHLMHHFQQHGEVDWEAVDHAATRRDPYVWPPERVRGNLLTRRYREAFQRVGPRAVHHLKRLLPDRDVKKAPAHEGNSSAR